MAWIGAPCGGPKSPFCLVTVSDMAFVGATAIPAAIVQAKTALVTTLFSIVDMVWLSFEVQLLVKYPTKTIGLCDLQSVETCQ